MKVKPKEVLLNLPIVLMFDNQDEINSFAANINALIHGKSKVKYDGLGVLGEKFVIIFYLQRNDEYHSLRDEFNTLIEQEELKEHSDNWLEDPLSEEEKESFNYANVNSIGEEKW